MLRNKLTILLALTLSGSVVATGASSLGAPASHAPRAGALSSTEAPVETLLGDPLRAYRGLGTWIDIYDDKEWKNPEASVAKMVRKGVTTLYLETANYRLNRALFRPGRMSRFIDAAKANDVVVIAWYLPGFKNLKKDFKRSRKAINFTSKGGNRFDGFSLDIEATAVRDIPTRNRRALRLSRRIDEFAKGRYALGAIIPDPAGQRYWPDFPYRKLAKIYDVFLPMGYYTYRVKGGAAVYRYSKQNVTILRREAGKPSLPVHNIGGIAGRATKREVTRFIDGSLDAGVIGGSLYDFPLTTNWEWNRLARFIPLLPDPPS